MTTKVLHINKPSKDILSVFMRLRVVKEEKIRAVKESNYKTFKKI